MDAEKKFNLVPGSEKDNEIELILSGILEGLERKKEEKGSYFDLIPPEYQKYVRETLANPNFEFFEDKFDGDFDAFLEAMSKNWLAKFETFGALAENAGFSVGENFDSESDPENKLVNEGELDDLNWAILTRSASYVLVSGGAFNRRGRGGQVLYARIPLRSENSALPEQEIRQGVYFSEIPAQGNPVRMENAPFTKTSDAIKVYTQNGENKSDLEDLSRSMSGSFIDIDHETLHGKD